MKTALTILVFVSQVRAASVSGAHVEVSIENVPGSKSSLIYVYKIVNGGGSRDQIKFFIVDVRGRAFGVGSSSHSLPPNWTFMGVRSEELTWATNDNGLAIGQTSGAIKLKSDGLPAVRAYRLAPSISKIPIDPPKDSGDLKSYLMKVEGFKRSSEAHGLTLAPVAPPSPFVPLAFIDILSENFRELLANGFAKNRVGTGEIAQKLKVIRAAFENNNPLGAKKLCENLIREMDIQKKDAHQPEVYALVKFNLTYLVDKLSKEQL